MLPCGKVVFIAGMPAPCRDDILHTHEKAGLSQSHGIARWIAPHHPGSYRLRYNCLRGAWTISPVRIYNPCDL